MSPLCYVILFEGNEFTVCHMSGTNINEALRKGIEHLAAEDNTGPESGRHRTSMIIFLTDGNPTVGVTNTNQIVKNVHAANEGNWGYVHHHNMYGMFMQSIALSH